MPSGRLTELHITNPWESNYDAVDFIEVFCETGFAMKKAKCEHSIGVWLTAFLYNLLYIIFVRFIKSFISSIVLLSLSMTESVRIL